MIVRNRCNWCCPAPYGSIGDMKWMGYFLLLCVALGLGIAGCSKKEMARSRPATRMFDRSMAQLGMIKLIVKDRKRAREAAAILEDLEKRFIAAEQRKAKESAHALGMTGEPTDEEIRTLFLKASDKDANNLREYAKAQIRLREVLTEKEFRRLAEVR